MSKLRIRVTDIMLKTLANKGAFEARIAEHIIGQRNKVVELEKKLLDTEKQVRDQHREITRLNKLVAELSTKPN